MSRISIPAAEQTPAASRPLLDAVRKQLGVVPNLMKVMGNSPAALGGYLALGGALAKGGLGVEDGRTNRAGHRRDQPLRLLPGGTQLSRQERRQAGRRGNRRQPQWVIP